MGAEIGALTNMRKPKVEGFTLIELLIVVAIVGILAAVAIPVYRGHVVRARLVEVTYSMGALSRTVANYYQDNGRWPPALTTSSAIANTLGLAIPMSQYIESVDLDDEGKITFQIQNSGDPAVNAGFLTLAASATAEGAITFRWGASPGFPRRYVPKE